MAYGGLRVGRLTQDAVADCIHTLSGSVEESTSFSYAAANGIRADNLTVKKNISWSYIAGNVSLRHCQTVYVSYSPDISVLIMGVSLPTFEEPETNIGYSEGTRTPFSLFPLLAATAFAV